MGCQDWLELRHQTRTEADWLRHGGRGLLRAEAAAAQGGRYGVGAVRVG